MPHTHILMSIVFLEKPRFHTSSEYSISFSGQVPVQSASHYMNVQDASCKTTNTLLRNIGLIGVGVLRLGGTFQQTLLERAAGSGPSQVLACELSIMEELRKRAQHLSAAGCSSCFSVLPLCSMCGVVG